MSKPVKADGQAIKSPMKTMLAKWLNIYAVMAMTCFVVGVLLLEMLPPENKEVGSGFLVITIVFTVGAIRQLWKDSRLDKLERSITGLINEKETAKREEAVAKREEAVAKREEAVAKREET